MEYTKERMVQDFAKRTMANLKHVQDNVKNGDLYEVTQLVNSLLGLIVFPRERAFDAIPKTSFEELALNGWARGLTAKKLKAKELQMFIRKLRNAVSHCNLGFVVDEHNKLVGIKFWNLSKKKKRIWNIQLSVDEILSIVGFLVQFWGEKLTATNFEIIRISE